MRILLIEDTRFFGEAVRKALSGRVQAEIVWARDYAQARAALADHQGAFDLALVDLVLPDATNGEAKELCLALKIPVIVFSGSWSDAIQLQVRRGEILDFIVKQSLSCLDYLVNLVEGFARNRRFAALVVRENAVRRRAVARSLRMFGFRAREAASAAEAMPIIRDDPDLRVLVTDFDLPDEDGMEFVRALRRIHPLQKLVILGMFAPEQAALAARFVKLGANDFLLKPVSPEELFVRTMKNMQLCEMVDQLSEAVNTDALTGLHSRSYFFDAGRQLFASWRRGQIELTLALVDIDHFKSINDTYGHEAGDEVLASVARNLIAHSRETDIIARIGGEEFVILLVNMKPEAAAAYFEARRAELEALEVPTRAGPVRLTASFGVTFQPAETLEDLLEQADRMLYAAKRAGRNQVLFAPEAASPSTQINAR